MMNDDDNKYDGEDDDEGDDDCKDSDDVVDGVKKKIFGMFMLMSFFEDASYAAAGGVHRRL